MSELLYGSICLSDIPKEYITKSEKNGKQYLNIAVPKLKNKGKFGETHAISVSIPRDQRNPDEKPIYIGNLKTWVGDNKRGDQQTSFTQDEDDLPF